ncbi:putative repeat protein (TIGR03837 family) [Silvimonas terrae]|uniref:Protein-arginine rhamnosyltransferase n=1 Tax=Silvimonas terrae TaxID=300266 RepID=A0A840REL5_9NEIS|nr:elongation factor P maturation arginine rhamnosyltransferase EarP [Silvimonas terrae]MBB5190793.1 putative repeat protein (TIGR03837 family) [Silvimonas terrae]
MNWSVFCRVVDNYGDIGVCWRLSRQLQTEYDQQVTLWVDDLTALSHIAPATKTEVDEQVLDGVYVRHWHARSRPADDSDVVIEAFACELPLSMQGAMRQRASAPVWLNLEYLSAEDWVISCHGMASPQGGLTKYFFFPGFAPGTGGVLAEQVSQAARNDWQWADRTAWLAALGVTRPDVLTVSLFGYENHAIVDLIGQMRASNEPLNLLVPVGRALSHVAEAVGAGALSPGQRVDLGGLHLYIVPMLAQAQYDRLLWSCDLNFVRGEDSFVRAQHARHPLVWHIYPQDDAAHEIKLAAFVDRYTRHWPAQDAEVLRAFWLAWNRGALVPGQWALLRALLPHWQAHARVWSERLDGLGNLAGNLVKFAKTKLK